MNFYFSNHAVRQMFSRNISTFDVQEAIQKGETVKEYADDKPYPSRLVLAIINQRPIHVVYSINDNEIIVITAYEPTMDIWENDFKTRKTQ